MSHKISHQNIEPSSSQDNYTIANFATYTYTEATVTNATATVSGNISPQRIDFESKIAYEIELLKNKIRILENQIIQLEEISHTRNIENDLAEKEIKDFILYLKKNGKTKIDIIDLVDRLNLPPEQIEFIMNKFTKMGKVRELNE